MKYPLISTIKNFVASIFNNKEPLIYNGSIEIKPVTPSTPSKASQTTSLSSDKKAQLDKAKELLAQNFTKTQVASDLGISTRTLGRLLSSQD